MAVITLSRPQGEAVPAQVVGTKTSWADAWTTQSELHCVKLAASTCETISTAEFHHRFGYRIKDGETSFSTIPVAVISALSYVKVAIAGTGGRAGFIWGGVWKSATKTDTVQRFTAVGLETLLENPCDNVPYWEGTSVRWAGRGLRFNARGLPNRSAAKHTVNGVDVYVFDDTGTYPAYWSTRDAVEMLLAVAAPLAADGSVIFNWTPSNLAALPDWDHLLDEETHGTSYLNLLRALVPRQRLIGFGVRLESDDTVTVAFDTFTATAIDVTDADGNVVGTIPANSAQDSIVITADQSATHSLSTEADQVVDQVIATGARRKSVFSLSRADGDYHFLGRWRAEDETRYKDAARNAADYPPDTEPREQEERNKQARASEELRQVFSDFGPLVSTWPQKAGDGEGGVAEEDQSYVAVVDEDAETEEWFRLYTDGLEFTELLPLLTGYEYYWDKISEKEGEPGHHGTEIEPDTGDPPTLHEPLPILAFVRVVPAAKDSSSTDRWMLADQLARTAEIEHKEGLPGRRWSADVRAVRDKLQLELRTQGEAQHVIAADEMDSHADAIEGAIDWQVDLIVTVCVEDWRDTQVRYPADDDVVCYGELVRRLRIEAPQYGMVRVLPNTVVGGYRAEQTLQRTSGGLLEDDRPQLLLLAKRTYEWHRQPRYVLNLSTGWIDGALGVGHLITALTDVSGTYPVNTVVSEITLEFPVANTTQPPRATLTLATAFAEMDAQALY